MELSVMVRNKIATSDGAKLIADNSDYSVKFYFDSEWDAFTSKTMRVQHSLGYTDVVFSGDTATLPQIPNVSYIKIGVYAGNLHTTTSAYYEVVKSVRSDSGSPVAPSQSVYDQIMAELGNKVNKIEGKGLSENDYSDEEKQKVADAYAVKHSHSNKAVLDGISASDVTAWNGKLSDAPNDDKQYARKNGEWSEVESGTVDYTDLANKPQINGITLSGNKSSSDLGIPTVTEDPNGNPYKINGKEISARYDGNGDEITTTYLKEHQSLSAYRTSSAQDIIDNAIKADVDAAEADIDDIEALIPSQATSENQLADKSFVNSSIATNTAHYIYKTVGEEKVPFDSVAELEAYSGTVTPNDYAFVSGTDSEGNAYYDRYKADVNGSTVTWAKEYRLNNSSFTAVQWSAIQSGITALLVASYNAHLADTGIHVTSADKANWNGHNQFWAVYGETTYAEVEAARSAGKAVFVKFSDRQYAYAAKTETTLYFMALAQTTAYILRLSSSDAWVSTSIAFENKSYKVQSISSSSTNDQYPTALAVYNAIANDDKNQFWAEFGVTTYAQITEAISAGKAVFCNYDGYQYQYYGAVTVGANEYYYLTSPYTTSVKYVRVKTDDTWSSGNANLEATNRKVTSLSASSTDTEYPSAKCVYDSLAVRPTALTASVGYYVSSSGSDSNAGTQASPFATVAKAMSMIPKNLNGCTASINLLSDITITESLRFNYFVNGELQIKGEYTISCSADTCLWFTGCSNVLLAINGITMTSNNSNNGSAILLNTQSNVTINIRGLTITNTSSSNTSLSGLQCQYNSKLLSNRPLTFSGKFSKAIYLMKEGEVAVNGTTTIPSTATTGIQVADGSKFFGTTSNSATTKRSITNSMVIENNTLYTT